MTSTKTKWVNPSILKWARERLRLTPQEVECEAQKLKRRYYAPISAKELERWERGLDDPELVHLETLSEIYDCPVGYFFLERPPEEEKLPLSLRGVSKTPDALSPTTWRTLRRFYDLALWTVELIKELDISWTVKIRPGQVVADPSQVKHIVLGQPEYSEWRAERAELNEDRERALQWWRTRIEKKGVFCFQMRLEPSEVRGATLWIEDKYPFILINRNDVEAASGRLFTLLHEYAHLITEHEGILCDFRGVGRSARTERFCNCFAAQMLVSKEELEDRLTELGYHHRRERWADRVLDEIRRPLMVSRDVVVVMLQEMDLAPKDLYDKKRKQWEKRKPWGRRPGRLTKKETKLRELGYSLTKLLARHSEHPAFPWLDVAFLLDTKVEKVSEFLEWAEQRQQ